MSRPALRLRPCQVPSSGSSHASSRQAQQSWGRLRTGVLPRRGTICPSGDEHPHISEAGLCKGDPHVNVPGSLQESRGKLDPIYCNLEKCATLFGWGLRVLIQPGCMALLSAQGANMRTVPPLVNTVPLFMNQHSCLSGAEGLGFPLNALFTGTSGGGLATEMTSSWSGYSSGFKLGVLVPEKRATPYLKRSLSSSGILPMLVIHKHTSQL